MTPSKLRTVSLMALGLFLLPLCALAQEPAAAEAAKAAPAIFPLLSRWFHVLGAIMLLGGAIYFRFVLMPAAKETLDDETHQKLRAGVIKRWGRILHVLILILLVSGIINFVFAVHLHKGQGAYHMLFSIKFILALLVFGLASMLAGRRSFSQKLQQNAGLWLGITIAMGVAIVLIAGYMKMM